MVPAGAPPIPARLTGARRIRTCPERVIAATEEAFHLRFLGRSAVPDAQMTTVAALLLFGTGLALAAGQSLLAIVRTAPHAGSFTVTLALGLLAAATISAGHDLRGGRA